MDRSTVETLFRTHVRTVKKCCRRILRDRDEVEDVVQEVFVKLLATGGRFQQVTNWDAYLARMSTRTCLNRLRDSRRRRELLEQHGGALVRTPEGVPDTVSARQLLRFILQLGDESTRDIVYYYYGDGMSQREIGEVMGISGSAVGKHLKKFQARLARHPEWTTR